MSAGPVWARIRVIGDDGIEYTRRMGRIALAHGEHMEVDLVRQDLFESADDGGTARSGRPEVRVAGVRLGLAEAEQVGEWVRQAVDLARSEGG